MNKYEYLNEVVLPVISREPYDVCSFGDQDSSVFPYSFAYTASILADFSDPGRYLDGLSVLCKISQIEKRSIHQSQFMAYYSQTLLLSS